MTSKKGQFTQRQRWLLEAVELLLVIEQAEVGSVRVHDRTRRYIIDRLRDELQDMGAIGVELTLSRTDAQALLHILQVAEDMRLQTLREDRP